MNSVQSIIGDKTAGLLISGLIGRGFSEEQAQRFLPEASSKIIAVFDKNDGITDANTILDSMDLAAIAFTVGVDNKLIQSGMNYLLPNIFSQLGGNRMGEVLSGYKHF